MLENGDPAYFVLFFILLLMDVLVYGFQAAVNSVDEKELEKKSLEVKGKRAFIVKKYVDNSARVNHFASVVVTLIHIIMGASFLVWLFEKGRLSEQLFPEVEFLSVHVLGVSLLHILVSVVITILFIYIIVCFGIMLPRKLAERSPESWALKLAGIMRFIEILFTPILAITKITTEKILILLGLNDEEDAGDIFEREIIDMVNEGHEQGAIEANEAELIHNIFEYGDKEVQDIMTNRSNIIAIDAETTLEEALQFMLDESYSRYPVYQETLDHIIGVLYLKDTMRFYNANTSRKQPVSQVEGLLRKAEYTPLTRNIDDLFETMQVKKLQMAVVVDEYGQTAGLVTMEDILEEIVGKIQDEYDEDEEFIEETSNDAYVMEGMTPLQDIEEQLGITFDDTEYETLNGFMIGLMNHIPEEDEDFESEYKGYSFKVLSIENMRVQSVLVQKLTEKTEIEEED